MTPPTWALLQREVLRTSSEACERFYASVAGYKFEHMEMPGMRYTLLLRAAKRPDGKYETEIVQRVFTDYVDSYAKDCHMK